jgi:hypothetical protein
MALFRLTECIDEGLCGQVTLEAPSREAALAFILRHWDRLKGAFGGAYKDLNHHLRSYCEGHGVQVRNLSPVDLERILKQTRIDGDSKVGYELRELDPIDTTKGPPPVLRKGQAERPAPLLLWHGS